MPGKITELPPPSQDGFKVDIAYDGTREGFITAALAYLADAPPDVLNASLVFDGEIITLTADMARRPALLH